MLNIGKLAYLTTFDLDKIYDYMLHIWIVNASNLTPSVSVYQTELHTLVKLKHLLKMLFFFIWINLSNDKDTLVMV